MTGGYQRERWDRTQASVLCLLIALIGALPTWFTLALIGALA
jgi:hypothetical protein